MTSFRIFLIGSSQQLMVDLPAQDICELSEIASRVRFLTGHLIEADEAGICTGIMIQSNRIQCVFAVN